MFWHLSVIVQGGGLGERGATIGQGSPQVDDLELSKNDILSNHALIHQHHTLEMPKAVP